MNGVEFLVLLMVIFIGVQQFYPIDDLMLEAGFYHLNTFWFALLIDLFAGIGDDLLVFDLIDLAIDEADDSEDDSDSDTSDEE